MQIIQISLTIDESIHIQYCSKLQLNNSYLNNKKPFKGIFSSLRQFLATESSLKMIKNASYFTLKALFVLKMFKFLS